MPDMGTLSDSPVEIAAYWSITAGEGSVKITVGRIRGGLSDGQAAIAFESPLMRPQIIYVDESSLVDLATGIMRMNHVGNTPTQLVGDTGLIIARDLDDVERFR